MIIYGTIKKREIALTRNELAQKISFDKTLAGKNVLRNYIEYDAPIPFADIEPIFGYRNVDLQSIFEDRWPFSFSGVRKAYDRRWYDDKELYNKIDNEFFYYGLSSWETKDKLQFITQGKNLLTVDKRSFYILVIEIMKQVEGEISEDDQKTWISVEEFESRHQDILSLTYDEANTLSLKEAENFETVYERDADWETKEEYEARGWEWEEPTES